MLKISLQILLNKQTNFTTQSYKIDCTWKKTKKETKQKLINIKKYNKYLKK